MLFFSLKITSHSFLQKSLFCTSCCCPKILSNIFLKQSFLLLLRWCSHGYQFSTAAVELDQRPVNLVQPLALNDVGGEAAICGLLETGDKGILGGVTSPFPLEADPITEQYAFQENWKRILLLKYVPLTY